MTTFKQCKGCEEGDASDGKDGLCLACIEESYILAKDFIREELRAGLTQHGKCKEDDCFCDRACLVCFPLNPDGSDPLDLGRYNVMGRPASADIYPVRRERPVRDRYQHIPHGKPGFTNMLCPTDNKLTRWEFKKYERLQCTECGRFEKREDVV